MIDLDELRERAHNMAAQFRACSVRVDGDSETADLLEELAEALPISHPIPQADYKAAQEEIRRKMNFPFSDAMANAWREANATTPPKLTGETE